MITMISMDHAKEVDDRLTHRDLLLGTIGQIIMIIGPIVTMITEDRAMIVHDHHDDRPDLRDDRDGSSRSLPTSIVTIDPERHGDRRRSSRRSSKCLLAIGRSS
jgi:hypothetical protein